MKQKTTFKFALDVYQYLNICTIKHSVKMKIWLNFHVHALPFNTETFLSADFIYRNRITLFAVRTRYVSTNSLSKIDASTGIRACAEEPQRCLSVQPRQIFKVHNAKFLHAKLSFAFDLELFETCFAIKIARSIFLTFFLISSQWLRHFGGL